MSDDSRFNKIAVPVDFSDCSGAALERAAALQGVMGAQLLILHTYELPVLSMPQATLMAGEMNASLVERDARFAQQQLDEFITKRSLTRSDTVRTLIEVGPAAETIIAVAEREEADLVVMGTHGRTGLARVLLGSTTERVLRAVSCPVLTVRGP